MKKNAAFIGLYYFLFLTLFTALNRDSTGYISPGMQFGLYYADQLFFILGFLLFAYSAGCVRRTRILIPASCIGNAVLSVLLGVCPGRALFLYAAPPAVCGLGFLGGFVYDRMAGLLYGRKDRGLTMGIGMSAAAVLQYLLQIRTDAGTLLWGFDAAGVLVLMLFALRLPEEDTPGALDLSVRILPRETLLRLALIVACMTALLSFFDNRLELLQTQNAYAGTVHAYTWPRLLIVPAYLILGILFDRYGAGAISAAVICLLLLTVLGLVLMPLGWGQVILCLFYVMAGSYGCYHRYMFLDAAPRTKNRALWASVGSVIDGAVGVLLGAFSISRLSVVATAIAVIVLLAVLIVCMAWNGYLTFSPQSAGEGVLPAPEALPAAEGDELSLLSDQAAQQSLSEEERAERFSKAHGLTRREGDVLLLLLRSEDTTAVLASQLGISERMFYRHTKNIFEKAGVSTRAGLVRSFYREGGELVRDDDLPAESSSDND